MSYLALACRGLLAGVFLVSLGGKARGRAAYDGFVTATAGLLTVGRPVAHWLAAASVAAETAVLAALVIDVPVGVGVAASAGLLVCFTGALLPAVRRGTGARCHCLGAHSAPVGRRHLVRNVALIVVALGGLASATADPHYEPAGVVITSLAVVTGLLVVVNLDVLAALLARDGA